MQRENKQEIKLVNYLRNHVKRNSNASPSELNRLSGIVQGKHQLAEDKNGLPLDLRMRSVDLFIWFKLSSLFRVPERVCATDTTSVCYERCPAGASLSRQNPPRTCLPLACGPGALGFHTPAKKNLPFPRMFSQRLYLALFWTFLLDLLWASFLWE